MKLRASAPVEWIRLCLLTLAILVGSQSSFGQSDPGQKEASAPVDGSHMPRTNFRFTLIWNGRFGSYTYVPGKWGEAHLALENGQDHDRNVICASSFEQNPNLQFGRQIWLPAHSKLSISHPILAPQIDAKKENSARLRSLVIEEGTKDEVAIKSEDGQVIHDSSMLISQIPRQTGIIAGVKEMSPGPEDVINLLNACRVNRRLDKKLTVLGNDFLPTEEWLLNYLDHLVLAENRLLDDVAALSAVRRWLHSGGRLWVMVDRVSPALLENLFGDEFRGSIVDRISLTSVQIDRPPSATNPEGEAGKPVEYDDPIDLVRMYLPDVRVRHTVNGWPVAMTKTYGSGRVLFTTLGARAWMEPNKTENRPKNTPHLDTDYVVTILMQDMAAYLFQEREAESLAQEDLEPLAGEQIGYQIPSWSLIIGTLFLFLLLLICFAVVMARRERLEHLGWSGSLLGVIFSGVLLTIGWSYRHTIPGTLASVQFVQAIAGTDDVLSRGALAVYHPEGSSASIATTHGGLMWPDMQGREHTTRRLVTTDLGSSHWEGLTQPAGLQLSPFASSKQSADRFAAYASLDAEGLVGNLVVPKIELSDAMVATRQGRLGVQLLEGGKFSARAENVFEPDQFLDAKLLGDEQDRHRRIFQKLFQKQSQTRFPNRPSLLLWLNDWDNGFEFGSDLKRKGDTLIAVPLVLQHPTPGTQITIPSVLISYQSCPAPDGVPPSGMLDDAHGEWQDRSNPGVTWLRFQIPHEVLPLAVTQARLQIKVSGPIGRIEILGLKNGAVESLRTIVDPIGALTIDVEDVAALSVSESGELKLGLSAGVADRTTPATQNVAPPNSLTGPNGAGRGKGSYWRIQSLNLQLRATVAETDRKS